MKGSAQPIRRPNRTLGGVHDEFWTHCSSNRLFLQVCADCTQLQWPPTQSCRDCNGVRLTWTFVSGRGRVVSWCSFFQQYYDSLAVPYDVILVELDEGPMFVSNPGNFSVGSLDLGARVQVQFIHCRDDVGEFELPVFALLVEP